jgi:hypothetical protein
MFDWREFWNPKVRAADCLNPQAARSILPIADLRQDGDGRPFQGGDRVGNQSSVPEQTAPEPRERRYGIHDVEIGVSDRRRDYNGPHLVFITSQEQ